MPSETPAHDIAPSPNVFPAKSDPYADYVPDPQTESGEGQEPGGNGGAVAPEGR